MVIEFNLYFLGLFICSTTELRLGHFGERVPLTYKTAPAFMHFHASNQLNPCFSPSKILKNYKQHTKFLVVLTKTFTLFMHTCHIFLLLCLRTHERGQCFGFFGSPPSNSLFGFGQVWCLIHRSLEIFCSSNPVI